MENRDNNQSNREDRILSKTPGEKKSTIPNDLPDSPHDEERLQTEETVINLPDVSDIPGQEFVHAPPMGAMADTTISSDDEEGRDVFDDFEEDDADVDMVMGNEADVSPDERKALEDETYLPTRDEDNLRRAAMDSTDFEGEPLNEESFGEEQSGEGLDIPDAVDETTTTSLGQGDEENKHYSIGSGDNDNVVEGTP